MANRNDEYRFGTLPTKTMPRSAFKMQHSLSTSLNTGRIIPIYWKEVLPGDSFKMKVSELVRMTTPINPVMSNGYIDTYFFSVPWRLVDEHWEEFMGENKDDAWTQKKEYIVPQVQAPEGGWIKGSLASYFGVRTYTEGISWDAKWLRSYALIYNKWFRNENVTEPVEIPLGQETTYGSNGDDPVTDIVKGGMPAKAVKFSSYLTRALPEPQKGESVFLPLGETAPIIGTNEVATGQTAQANLIGKNLEARGINAGGYVPSQIGNTEGNYLGDGSAIGLAANLEQATAGTINQLRQAFAIQRLLELDAVGGTEYRELLRAHFKVTSPDSRLQIPEYLGGKRIPINMLEVSATAESEGGPIGTEGAHSKTIDNEQYIEGAFVEHGCVIGLAVIRTEHEYQQRIERSFSRHSRLDYYFPELANLGNQSILNKEIFAQGNAEDDEVFGYQEAWAEYRYEDNIVTGELNSDYPQALDNWTWADKYDSLPTLSDEWIKETDVNVQRTLAIQNQDQFIANFYFESTWYRPLPIYSIPSLTGWH